MRRVNHDDQRTATAPTTARLRAELIHVERLWERLDSIAVGTRGLPDAAALEQPCLRTLDARQLAAA